MMFKFFRFGMLMVAMACCALMPATSWADLINVGSTYYAEDFDSSTIGSLPTSTNGVTWHVVGGSSTTNPWGDAGDHVKVVADPAGGTNQVLQIRADNANVAYRSAAVADLSGAAGGSPGAPMLGTLSFRMYIDANSSDSYEGYVKLSEAATGPGSLLVGSEGTLLTGVFQDANPGPANDFKLRQKGFQDTGLDFLTGEWLSISMDFELNVGAGVSARTTNVELIDSNGTHTVAGPIDAGTKFASVNDFLARGIAFQNRNFDQASATGDVTHYFDDISITTAVPEPGSLALMSIAALSMFVRRRFVG